MIRILLSIVKKHDLDAYVDQRVFHGTSLSLVRLEDGEFSVENKQKIVEETISVVFEEDLSHIK